MLLFYICIILIEIQKYYERNAYINMNAVATITSRGQVTLPRMIRKALDSRIIEFDVQNNVVLVRPVRSVAGGLAQYARKLRPLAEVRAEVWKEVARAKAKSHPS